MPAPLRRLFCAASPFWVSVLAAVLTTSATVATAFAQAPPSDVPSEEEPGSADEAEPPDADTPTTGDGGDGESTEASGEGDKTSESDGKALDEAAEEAKEDDEDEGGDEKQADVDHPFVQKLLAKNRGGPPPIKAPVPGEPRQLLSVPNGPALAVVGDRVVDIESGELVLSVKGEDPGFRTIEVWCAAGPETKVACLRLAMKSSRDQTQTAFTYIDTDGTTRELERGGNELPINFLGIDIRPDGRAIYAYAVTERQGDKTVTYQYVYDDDERIETNLDVGGIVESLAAVGSGGRYYAPIRFIDHKGKLTLIYRSGSELFALRPGKDPVSIAPSSLYDVRVVVGGDGVIYVFYHEPASKTARMASSVDGLTWRLTTLDSKESGWQVDAVPTEDGVVAVFYYFKNSFNKGLRTIRAKDGRLAKGAVTIFREDRFNAGWHPHLAVTGSGTVYLTYLANVEEEQRVWHRFVGAQELRARVIEGEGGWEDEYKDYFLQTGAGGWLTLWHLADFAPDPADTGGQVGATEYDVGMTILVTANVEARYKWIDVGLSYAQGIIDEAAEEIEDATGGVLSGNVKIEELLPGHDVKVAAVWGRYKGRGTAGDNVTAENGPIDLQTNYIDTQLLALNQWRVKYGLAYSNYTIPMSVHVWTAPENQTAYSYEGSFLRNVNLQDFDLILGYSKLDYAAKYENYYNGIIVDGAGAFGLTYASFDAIDTSLGETTDALSFHIRGQVMLGWLLFSRWKDLQGFGLYVRPAYRAEVAYTGTPGKPGDRDSDSATSDSVLATIGLFSLRHGPWLDAGAVW